MVDDALAQEGESGAAEHLPLDQLDFADVAFHGGGAVGQGEACGDGLLVAADAAGEGAELGRSLASALVSQPSSSAWPWRRAMILAKARTWRAMSSS